MPKSTLAAANSSAQQRHALSGSTQALYTGLAQILANVASHLHFLDHRDSQSVTAIGYDLNNPNLVLVARNGQLTKTGLLERVDKAIHNVGNDWGDILADNIFDYDAVSVNDGFGETQGWHAEMMIARWLLINRLNTKTNFNTGTNNGGLTIGASSTCCPDCSGWMTRYGIAHAPIGIGGTAASAPWRNPGTASAYGYEGGQVSYYLAPGMQESLGKY